MAIDICTKALNSAGETLDTSLMAGYDLTSHCIRLTLTAVIGEIQLHGIHNQHICTFYRHSLTHLVESS